MQLIVDIKNSAVAEKIIQILNVFKDDGVEIKEQIEKEENKTYYN